MQNGWTPRTSPRVGFEAVIEYTPYRLLLPRLGEERLRGRSVDVSEDALGLCFVTAHPLYTGRRLQLTTGGVARTAEVRWVAAVPEGYRAGVAFSPDPVPPRA